jgi:hypothetical protein
MTRLANTFTVLAILLFASWSNAAEQMSVETSWENVPRCIGRNGKNAKMIIKNAPHGTKFITATLKFGQMELGGDRAPVSENGIVAEGALHLMAPCTPGTYRWTISAEDAIGRVLSTIQKDAIFP